jgi:multiple sugar transport system substrate-binding protein
MRRLLVQMAVLALVAGACTAGNDSAQQGPAANASNVPHTPTTLTMWVAFSGRELRAVTSVVEQFHTQYPWITVKMVGAKNQQETLQAINSGTPPDVMSTSGPDQVAEFCSSHAWADLNPYLKADGIDLSKISPPAATTYTSYQGVQCALPLETDAYGLYYNKDLFAKAGIAGPEGCQNSDSPADRRFLRMPGCCFHSSIWRFASSSAWLRQATGATARSRSLSFVTKSRS